MIKIFILSIKLNHYFLLYNTPATITDINVNHPNPLPTLPIICPGKYISEFHSLIEEFPIFFSKRWKSYIIGIFVIGIRVHNWLKM